MESVKLGKTILQRIADERTEGKTQQAHGLVEFVDPKKVSRIAWLVYGALGKGHLIIYDFKGNPVHPLGIETPYLQRDLVFSKNSPFGNAFAQLDGGVGDLSVTQGTNKITHQVISSSKYHLENLEIDAYQGRIHNTTDQGLIFENSLKQRLIELDAILSVSQSGHDKQALELELNRLKEDIAALGKRSHRFRRTTVSIRQQFLLDPHQNTVKRKCLLKGSLIIAGGPGTGKTTLLIHRIQYMLDKEVEKDEHLTVVLTEEEKLFIRNQRTGWIFFTPTTLLKKYLEQAMIAEGLEAHDETVKTWEQQREILKMSLQLFSSTGNRSFLAYRDDQPLWNLTSQEIKKLTSEFDAFALKYYKAKLDRIQAIKTFETKWKKEAYNIAAALAAGSIKDESSLILAINLVVEKYDSLRQTNEKEYNDQVGDLSSSIQSRLSAEDREWFKNQLQKQVEPPESEEDSEEADESFDEEASAGRLELDINRAIRHAIRNLSIQKIDKTHRLSQRDTNILPRIEKFLAQERLVKISSPATFLKYLRPVLRGSDHFILSGLNTIYKTFRRESIASSKWLPQTATDKVKSIINESPRNRRLHDDEVDFLIMLSLRLARVFRTVSPKTFKDSTQNVISAFQMSMKGLVAVDEATDFSPTQLYSMYLLSMPRLNSITFCGDLMQQMNNRGLNTWEGIKDMLPNVERAQLLKSYRQTPRLLELASVLYEKRYGERPSFIPSEEDLDNPPPLVKISDQFDEKVNWIASRIAELFKLYEKVIPNIAVFVKNNESIQPFAQALNDSNTLYDLGIRVKPCIGESDIGSSDYVRVFNINLIKGMEFEAVFFIDVDDYSDKTILDKLLYVGVSRATYYLAITMNKGYPEQLEPIKGLLVENGNWASEGERDY